MGTIVFKIFQTKLEVETMVSGFGDARKCAGKGGWELNKNNDVVILSFPWNQLSVM